MKKGVFSKFIVIFCILEMTAIQAWAMYIAMKSQFMVTALLAANHGVFGGELLLLCLKRILSSKTTDEENIGENFTNELSIDKSKDIENLG